MTDVDHLFRIDGLNAEPGLIHGFSSLRLGAMERRDGGDPPHETPQAPHPTKPRKLGFAGAPGPFRGDPGDVCTPERLALLEALGLGSRADQLTTLGAVHGTQVVEVDGQRGSIPRVDGLITNQPGVPLLATFGDCCPLVLYDPRHHVLALSHAGWRGTARAMASRTVAALHERYGTAPADLLCGIGPSICGDCYEVGPEVAVRFQGLGSRPGPGDRTLLDVGEVNRLQLIAAGVAPDRIHRHPACTRETPELPSHRRDHDGRRFAAVVALR